MGKDKNELASQIRDIYPSASEEGIEEYLELANRHGLDPGTTQLTLYESESMGRWRARITRHGYRKIARQQEGYVSHHYLSYYRGDKLIIKPEEIIVEIGSETRAYNDLLGAIAWMYLNGKLYFTKISYSDYSQLKHSWDQNIGKPDAMLQKEAEVTLIQKVFSELFESTKAEADTDDEIGMDATRADLLAYIKDNHAHISEQPSQPLIRCSTKELFKLKEQIIRNKGESQ